MPTNHSSSISVFLERLGLKNKTIYKTISPVSGEIEIRQLGGTTRMLIGGMTQSVFGNKNEMAVWRAMPPKEPISSCLILGLGAGTLICELKKKHPNLQITGYELDPVVVEMANKFFELDPAVKVKILDVEKDWPEGKYDLIIDDLFKGRQVPQFVASKRFIAKVHGHLNPGGQAVFNYINMFKTKNDIENLEKNLNEEFGNVRVKKVRLNTLYWVRDAGSN